MTSTQRLALVQAALDNAYQEQANLSSLGKVSYNAGGQGVDWDAHMRELDERIKRLIMQIKQLQGPYFIQTRMY